MKRTRLSSTLHSHRKHKHNQDNNENEDRLSDLPDCLLLHILSFLEAKQAVQTCILSTRWKNIWKRLSTLTLSNYGFKNIKCFTRFVSRILSLRDNSTALYALDFHRDGVVEPWLLKRIMNYIASHNVQQLRIHVRSNLEQFPTSFFSCHTLTSLDLYSGHKFYDRIHITVFSNSLDLPALTSLSLTNFIFYYSDDGCVEPFSTFKRLNSLIIKNCCVFDGHNLSISSVTLVNLTIEHEYGEICQISKIELFTPSLSTFTFIGAPLHILCGSHLSSVKNVNIDADMMEYFAKYLAKPPSFLLSWLLKLTDIESLTVSSDILQVLSLVPDLLKVEFRSLCNLKSLKVKMKRLSNELSKALIDANLAQLPAGSHKDKEAAKLEKTFKAGSTSTIPNGVIDFLLQNSLSVIVDFIK